MIDYIFFFVYMLYFNSVVFFGLKQTTTILTLYHYFIYENYFNVKTNLTMIMLFIVYQLLKNV